MLNNRNISCIHQNFAVDLYRYSLSINWRIVTYITKPSKVSMLLTNLFLIRKKYYIWGHDFWLTYQIRYEIGNFETIACGYASKLWLPSMLIQWYLLLLSVWLIKKPIRTREWSRKEAWKALFVQDLHQLLGYVDTSYKGI